MKKYSYTNKQGEKVEVTEEHLMTAVRIKIALQEASPSRKASWKKIKELMEEEGYFDAENNESYRVLVKTFQKKKGLLPSKEKYAELVAKGTLDSIKDLVGELSYEKRENQNVLREINKGKRTLIDFALVLEELVKAFNKHDFKKLSFKSNSKHKLEEDYETENELVMCLSDIHVGAIVDNDKNQYNYNVAVERIGKYLSKAIETAELNRVDKIHLVGLGDMIEHATMRYGQAYDAEFNFSEQIVKSSDLIIKTILFLLEQGYKVSYAGIAGNHDRITDKDKNLDNDHAVKVINKIVESFFLNVKANNFEYVQAEDYKHSLIVNGLSILCLHGDLDSRKDNGIIRKHEILNGEEYDLLLIGHFHSVEIREISDDKFMAIAGSIKGQDNYSKNKIRKSSSASQLMVLVDKDGNYDFKIVKLD